MAIFTPSGKGRWKHHDICFLSNYSFGWKHRFDSSALDGQYSWFDILAS